jgi:hypothetical protein
LRSTCQPALPVPITIGGIEACSCEVQHGTDHEPRADHMQHARGSQSECRAPRKRQGQVDTA